METDWLNGGICDSDNFRESSSVRIFFSTFIHYAQNISKPKVIGKML
jgi:hypothetical protein